MMRAATAAGYDPSADIGGARLFPSKLKPRFFMLNGAVPCTSTVPSECGTTTHCNNAGSHYVLSDLNHSDASLFHVMHTILNDRLGNDAIENTQTKFYQIHAAKLTYGRVVQFADGTNRFSNAPDSTAILFANRVRSRPTEDALIKACQELGVASPNCAVDNMQGLYTNLSGNAAAQACSIATSGGASTDSHRFLQSEGASNISPNFWTRGST